MENFLDGDTTVSFIVKNITGGRGRIIKVFQQQLYPGMSVDVMKMPGIGENTIRESLLRGDLGRKIKGGLLEVVSSTVAVAEKDTDFIAFLNSIGLSSNVISSGGGGGGWPTSSPGTVDIVDPIELFTDAEFNVRGAEVNLTTTDSDIILESDDDIRLQSQDDISLYANNSVLIESENSDIGINSATDLGITALNGQLTLDASSILIQAPTVSIRTMVPNQYLHLADPNVRTSNIGVGDHIQFDSTYASHVYSPPNITHYGNFDPYTTALSTNSIGRVRLGKGTFKLTAQIPFAVGDGYLVYGWEHVNISNSNAGTRSQVYVPPGGGFSSPAPAVAIITNDGSHDYLLEVRIYRNTGFTAIGDATYNLWPWATVEELGSG